MKRQEGHFKFFKPFPLLFPQIPPDEKGTAHNGDKNTNDSKNIAAAERSEILQICLKIVQFILFICILRTICTNPMTISNLSSLTYNNDYTQLVFSDKSIPQKISKKFDYAVNQSVRSFCCWQAVEIASSFLSSQ